jgi:hypothetical protein
MLIHGTKAETTKKRRKKETAGTGRKRVEESVSRCQQRVAKMASESGR